MEKSGAACANPVTAITQVILAGCTLFAVAFSGCRGNEPGAVDTTGSGETPFLNIREGAATYVGGEVCASCHESEWSGFLTHGMARSYYPMSVAVEVEDFTVPAIAHPISGWFYRPIRTDTGYYQEEYRLDRTGNIDHRLLRRMDFVVGSGTVARTYLNESNGRLYQMPLTWYTQTGQWDFSPGFEAGNQRFDRAIVERCMACHNSYPESIPYADGKYVSVPEGISCERCHGPGSLHAEERLIESEAPDSIDYTILNPEYITLDRQLDVCQQCHLQTTVSMLRDGVGPFDYRPGRPLEDFVSLYHAGIEEVDAATIDVISHADRMKQSACFIGSLGRDLPMTCVTCHDPHEGFRDVGERYFDASCKSCHPSEALSERFASDVSNAQVHADGPACSSCHMPKTQATGATHATFTDHWVRVLDQTDASDDAPLVSRTMTPQPAHEPPELYPYFESDTARTDEDVYRGMAYVVFGRQHGDSVTFRRGRDELVSALDGRRGEYGEAWYLLGWALLEDGDSRAALDPLQESVNIEAVPERLNALALALEATGGDESRVIAAYRRALEIQPAAADIRINYGRFLEKLGRLGEALSEYQVAARERPHLATAHFNLGTAYLRSGDPARAEVALREAIQLDPDYDQAIGNLGLLFASTGRTDEAGEWFQRALRAAPTSAVAAANLATYYLGEGDARNAVPLFEQAVDLDPGYIAARLNLAVAYFQTGDEARARQQATEVDRLDPGNARAAEILRALD
jgi:Tfp pilus assembly protein PilF